MVVRPSAVRIIVTLERDLVAWVDDESFSRARERSWMVQEALSRWRRRLESERGRRAKARGVVDSNLV